jgi:glutamate synthase (NADPH) large chain
MVTERSAELARQARRASAEAALGRARAAAARGAPLLPRSLHESRAGRDSCGVGFIANMKGVASHAIVKDGLQIVENLTHRGAVGADPLVGDGAGMLLQIPHDFFKAVCAEEGFELPERGRYGVGFVFMPRDPDIRAHCEKIVERVIEAEGQHLLGWRTVPVDNSSLSKVVTDAEPVHRQVFIGRDPSIADDDAFERRLFILRKVISNAIFAETEGRDNGFYVVSMSSRTIVYKGMFLAYQLGACYRDLHDERFASALALVHQRFSTNTFPSWKLAHPYRMVAHNGEINTLRGNVNWMAARQASMYSLLFGDDMEKLWPISYEGQSDTACFDNALELLVMGGYELAHAAMMLIPEAWAGNPLMDADRSAFYEYHAALMEPWDGPAAMAFTDGRQIGATLDRNGLRPARYVVTDDDIVVMASEVGVLPIPEEKIVRKWRLQPGRMLLIDLAEGRIVDDDELKRRLTTANPYREWVARTQIVLEDLPGVGGRPRMCRCSTASRPSATPRRISGS